MSAYLTADLPGCGGIFKSSPEDFKVEEVPAYLPSGEPEGEHLFLWIEKRGRTTQEVARFLADALSLSDRDVSYAGMKDRQGVTKQYFCVPSKKEALMPTLKLDGMTLHTWTRHRNKLKTGHLKGNRFELKLRETTHPEHALACIRRLEKKGMPNYFGTQRFGGRGDNAALGKALLVDGKLETKPSRFQRKLFLSAYQSLLFNRSLDQRLEQNVWSRVLKGDILRKTETGGMFVCDSPDEDQPRFESFEVNPTGPLFGPEMMTASGGQGELEDRLLQEEGIGRELFDRGKGETAGARRPYRVKLEDVEARVDGDVVTLAFFLPRGSYATVILREVIKSESAQIQSDPIGDV